MADIKEVAEKTIKTVDSVKVATEKIKDTGIKTVNESKSAVSSKSKTVNEYGSERIEDTAHSAEQTAVYGAEKARKQVNKRIRKKFEQKYYSDRHQPQSSEEVEVDARTDTHFTEYEREPRSPRRTAETKNAPRRTQRTIQREHESPEPQKPGKKIKTVEAGEVKQKTKATYKSADTSIKTVERTTKETTKAAQKSKQAAKAANESKAVAKEAAKKSAQAAKKSAEIAKAAAKKAAQLAKKLEVEENGKKVKKEKIIRTVWLYIEHNSKTANQMAEEYGFSAKQKEYFFRLFKKLRLGALTPSPELCVLIYFTVTFTDLSLPLFAKM